MNDADPSPEHRRPLPRPPLAPEASPRRDLGPADLDAGDPAQDPAPDKEPVDERVLFDLPAPQRPPWLEKLALLLLAPLILGGGNPFVIAIGALAFAQRYAWLDPWLAVTAGVAVVTLPTFIGLALLIHRSVSYRRVIVDDRGFLFGKTDKWRGTRVRWADVEGFRLLRAGMMLKLKRRPWTRWLGPLVRTQDRATHELVVACEEQGVYRLGGG